MVDTHAHAPQFVNAGNGLDMPLLEWLETYTLPAETRFKDADYAKKSTCVCGDVCVRVRVLGSHIRGSCGWTQFTRRWCVARSDWAPRPSATLAPSTRPPPKSSLVLTHVHCRVSCLIVLCAVCRAACVG